MLNIFLILNVALTFLKSFPGLADLVLYEEFCADHKIPLTDNEVTGARNVAL